MYGQLGNIEFFAYFVLSIEYEPLEASISGALMELYNLTRCLSTNMMDSLGIVLFQFYFIHLKISCQNLVSLALEAFRARGIA